MFMKISDTMKRFKYHPCILSTMAERMLGSGNLAGNFRETFPNGATIASIKTGKSTLGPNDYGIVTVDGKLYSFPSTATKILVEALANGEVSLPAKIRVKETKGKGKFAYNVPVVVE